MDQEKMFFKGSERRKGFLEQKKDPPKKPLIFAFFSEGLVHGFCQKMEIF